ncbi:hypothetical protein HYFRA_00011617 [Hymenoscyphus fraxineus]|uniref:CMP/dCMP-type deaminase domain-containing protein n=1 Tax=Hymenoscyphus fraxineus TaxID=746836 RepID=A0A9N9KXI5_9HELO|nr:hypothetical protein HYFRA_00011617 [Hymenoscyphus fraxineus]
MPNQETISEEEKETHLHYMREALSMAELALQTSETPVGCVIVHPRHGIIGRGMNATNRTRNGTMHAEFIAINQILSPAPSAPLNTSSTPNPSLTMPTPEMKNEAEIKNLYPFLPSILHESTLYVTVEPCIMCASLLRQFGIQRVFFGASNEKFGGTGGVLDVHRGNGKVSGSESNETIRMTRNEEGRDQRRNGDYEVSGGWLREEAIVMLRRFYVQENGRAPEPRRKADRVLKLEVEPVVGGEGV